MLDFPEFPVVTDTNTHPAVLRGLSWLFEFALDIHFNLISPG